MTGRPDAGASRAVLVGVSSYTFLEPLPAVANNLPAMATALAAPGAWALPAGHCTVVAEPRYAHEVAEVLWQRAQEATDTMLFYFAGHGLIDSRGELLLGLRGSQPELSHAAIPYQSLRDIMAKGRAQRYVLILDCCFSGRALGLMSGTEDLIDTAQIDGSYLLAAAGENATALAPPGETYTAFTGELLDCLARGVPGGPPDLDLETVYRHLRTQLAAKGRPAPHKRDRNTAGSLVLARNTAHRPGPAQPRGPVPRAVPLPDPQLFTIARDFLDGLGQVRAAVPGLQVRHVAETAGISPGTVSSLLNRTTLPARWATTSAYLTACGLTHQETTAWQDAWERLRSLPPPAARPARRRGAVPRGRPPAVVEDRQDRPPARPGSLTAAPHPSPCAEAIRRNRLEWACGLLPARRHRRRGLRSGTVRGPVREQPQPRSHDQQTHHHSHRQRLLPPPPRTTGLLHPVTSPVIALRTLRHDVSPFDLPVVEHSPQSLTVAKNTPNNTRMGRFDRIQSSPKVIALMRLSVTAGHLNAEPPSAATQHQRPVRKAP